MHSANPIDEAKRVMTICNACRYCEGFCAVFPAMELRRTFSAEDMKYMANLCHNCRACYYACQYAPPHEFDLNVSKTFSALRLETYKEFAGYELVKIFFNKNTAFMLLAFLLSLFFIFFLVFSIKGPSSLFSIYIGANSFYEILPFDVMVIIFLLALTLPLVLIKRGISIFQNVTGMRRKDFFNFGAHIQAIKDSACLRYLDGNGEGCNYPDDKFRKGRKRFHHFLVYGFALCFFSTIIAFIYGHFFHIPAPYPFFSLPVILGTIGGVSIIFGSAGLFYLKNNMDRDPSEPSVEGMDKGFTLLVFLTALSGLLLMVFRNTALMGTLLVFHLALVLAFFLTLPCGKFVHAVYTYMALVKNAIEQENAKKGK